MEPSGAAAVGKDFPHTLRTMCYIKVRNDGSVTQGADRAAYERALSGDSRLFAVWPGEWSSHLFAIDDLDDYARAHGIKHDQERTGLANHVHDVRWVEAEREQNPRSPYVSIRVSLECGCEIHDLRTFADQMREQRDWVVATSGGWGRSSRPAGTTYSLRIRRKSLAS